MAVVNTFCGSSLSIKPICRAYSKMNLSLAINQTWNYNKEEKKKRNKQRKCLDLHVTVSSGHCPREHQLRSGSECPAPSGASKGRYLRHHSSRPGIKRFFAEKNPPDRGHWERRRPASQYAQPSHQRRRQHAPPVLFLLNFNPRGRSPPTARESFR